MQFEKFADLDLAHGRAATLDLGPMLYQDDINSIKLGVRLRNGSEPVEVEGTVVGRALLSNGATIPIESGEKDGSEAWVVIPQAALEVPGRVEYFVRIYDTETTAVALYAYGYVRRTATGTIIVPGDPLPDVEQLRRIAADCVTATENAQAAADHAVRYDTAQTLEAAQQVQARENISAAEADEFDTVAYPRGVEMRTSSDNPINVIAGGLSTTGGDTSNTARARTQYFRVQPGHRYLFELDDAEFGVLSVFEYTGTTMGSVIGRLDAEYFPNKRVAFTASGNFVRISFAHVDRTTTVTEEDRAQILAAISLRETASDNLAPVDNPTAAVTHTAGSLLTVSGQLYKATQVIAPGDAIAAGTNVTATSVAEQLAALEARIAALEG